MPSLNDIPLELLHASKRQDFVAWLMDTKTDYGTRRAICSLWTKYTCQMIPNYEWTKIKDSALD